MHFYTNGYEHYCESLMFLISLYVGNEVIGGKFKQKITKNKGIVKSFKADTVQSHA